MNSRKSISKTVRAERKLPELRKPTNQIPRIEVSFWAWRHSGEQTWGIYVFVRIKPESLIALYLVLKHALERLF